MARATAAARNPILPDALRQFLVDRAGEFAGLALLTAAMVLLAAIFTFSGADASWNTADAGPVQNLAGPPGAVMADLLLQTLGYAAPVLAILVGLWGWRLIRHKGLGLVWVRMLALPTSLLAAAAALAAAPAPTSWPFDAGLGGVAGDILFNQASAVAAPFLADWTTATIGLASAAMALVMVVLASGMGINEWRAAGAGSARAATASLNVLRKAPAALPAGRAAVERLRGSLTRTVPDDEKPQPQRSAGRIEPKLFSGAETQSLPEPSAAKLVVPRAAPPKPGRRAVAERQGKLDLPSTDGQADYSLPPLELLAEAIAEKAPETHAEEALARNAQLLESVLEDFGVQGEIVKVRPGPVVTLYELEPSPGTKSSRVIGLADDIARSMSAVSVRIAVVPGRNVIGIELPNVTRETVFLRELLESKEFETPAARLGLALGKDIGGAPVSVDLARMPHLLIAGTTGSGKSVAINTMILSLLYRLTPEQCRLIMIDPKMLELSVYDGIPHLLAPVVTEPGKAVVALKWVVKEMETRYRAMSELGVRNIASYNSRIADARRKGEVILRKVQTGFDSDTGKPIFEDQPLALDPLPFIVVVVDEMADLMLVAGKDIEAAVQRLAQMARAAGIHLIMATQRPSVDVITGTIKANFPSRVSFQVTSKIDSRTILGEQGAEQLLGQGDMLYMPAGGRPMRVHGPFVSDGEVESVVAALRAQGEPAYVDSVTEEDEVAGFEFPGMPAPGAGNSGDALYDQAVALVTRERKASTSFVQRHLQIGYNRAARLIEQMEAEGVIGGANHVGKREVLAAPPPGD